MSHAGRLDGPLSEDIAHRKLSGMYYGRDKEPHVFLTSYEDGDRTHLVTSYIVS